MRSFFIRPGERFAGGINHEACEAKISKDSMIRVEGDGRGMEISCIGGILWITQEGDVNDHFISTGDRFVIDRMGLVIIYSLSDAVIKTVTDQKRFDSRESTLLPCW